MDLIDPVARGPVGELLAGGARAPSTPTAVVTIPDTATAREALGIVSTHQVWGAPVVDGTGAIVANFSVSDVRHLASVTNQADADATLALPVLEFLQAGSVSKRASSLTPVVVQAGDSVSMAIQLLAESRLHHIYIVDGVRRPVGMFWGAVSERVRVARVFHV